MEYLIFKSVFSDRNDEKTCDFYILIKESGYIDDGDLWKIALDRTLDLVSKFTDDEGEIWTTMNSIEYISNGNDVGGY